MTEAADACQTGLYWPGASQLHNGFSLLQQVKAAGLSWQGCQLLRSETIRWKAVLYALLHFRLSFFS